MFWGTARFLWPEQPAAPPQARRRPRPHRRLVVGMTLPAFAQDWYIEDGDISISAGETGNKVTQGSTTKENDTDTVIKSKDSSTASSNTVTIHADEGKTVNVTLDNVTINVDEGPSMLMTRTLIRPL